MSVGSWISNHNIYILLSLHIFDAQTILLRSKRTSYNQYVWMFLPSTFCPLCLWIRELRIQKCQYHIELDRIRNAYQFFSRKLILMPIRIGQMPSTRTNHTLLADTCRVPFAMSSKDNVHQIYFNRYQWTLWTEINVGSRIQLHYIPQ